MPPMCVCRRTGEDLPLVAQPVAPVARRDGDGWCRRDPFLVLFKPLVGLVQVLGGSWAGREAYKERERGREGEREREKGGRERRRQ